MKRTLQLTSPHMRGADVKYAQRLVRKSPLTDMRPLVDGDYGPKMGSAVHRTKFLLGYPKREIDNAFGNRLESFLRRDAQQADLPAAYKVRRKARLAAEKRAHKRLGDKAIAEARRWKGTKEHPFGSNNCPPFTTWYHLVGSWCAIFVSFCLNRAGSKYPRAGRYWAYVPYVVGDARAHRNGLVALSRSDVLAWRRDGKTVLACFDWTHNGEADHIGFVIGWARPGWSLHTIEGNTGSTNWSNGGEVMERTDRNVTQVQQFVGVVG
jgi:hypothetical protein